MRLPLMAKCQRNLFLNATRGSLEQDVAWYYAELGIPGKEERVSRTALEKLYLYIYGVGIDKDTVYRVLVDSKPHKHGCWTGVEVVKYLCDRAAISSVSDPDTQFELRTAQDGFSIDIIPMGLVVPIEKPEKVEKKEYHYNPCPFCGNTNPKPRRYKGRDGWRDRFAVLCRYDEGGCGAEGGRYHTLEEAVEAWNRRAGG